MMNSEEEGAKEIAGQIPRLLVGGIYKVRERELSVQEFKADWLIEEDDLICGIALK